MSNLSTIQSCRKVIITGGIAVGKSSCVKKTCDILKKQGIKYIVVPEYIDALEDGVDMLNKYFNKQITVFEFQMYIINFYENHLSNLNIDGDEILIFERSVDDGITCFSNRDNSKNFLSDLGLYELYNKAKHIDETFNLPSYFDINRNKTVFIPIKTVDPEQDPEIIASIITNRTTKNVIIGLYNSDEECLKRVRKRGRKGEEVYTIQWLSDFNYNYSKLFKLLMEGKCINFTSLGKLIK